MHLLGTELLKLVSIRSPWLCTTAALVTMVAYGAAWAWVSASEPEPPGLPPAVGVTQIGYLVGLVVVMIMAVISATGEYATGTIKLTFLAVPNRTKALLAKFAVVGLVAGIIGETSAWSAYWLAKLINPTTVGPIVTAQQVRNIAGVGIVYLIGAVMALAIGVLIRHTGGAVALVLVYTLLFESMVGAIPKVGTAIHPWLPMNVAARYLTADSPEPIGIPWLQSDATLSAWSALAYLVAIGAALVIAAIVTINSRDA